MKAKNIRELSQKELFNTLNDLKNELFNLRFQHATGQLENPMRIKVVKRNIARVNTIIKELDKRA
ncbi:MAG: 50S ribosomal protein L29 [Bacillota bacterium]|nr:50S ribosomal protein L29 [Bacillota bacterium]